MTSCILTIIKNEHQYLDEWIKYHIDLGVDHIFIFEDVDSDSHKEITDKYGDKVTLDGIFSILDEEEQKEALELKLTKRGNPQEIYHPKGLTYIQNHYPNEYDWCFVIDNDEFITLENENSNIEGVLRLYQDYDAFIMQWKCYGANGLADKPDYKDNGVVGTYTKEIEGYVPTTTPQSLSKSCYNLNTYKETYYLYAHQPSRYCNFCRTNFEKNRNKPVYDNIYIRHYITKSWEEYVWKRKTRGFLFGKIRTYDFFFEVNPDMKHKKNELINKISNDVLVVLPYKQGGSQGNEIRLALNGWKKFCGFNYHFVVIGSFDKSLTKEFPWVEFINCPRIGELEHQYTQHLDVQRCMEIVAKRYNGIYDGFIWMADDNYAIKPFVLKDITRIHYHSIDFQGQENAPTSYWNHDKWKTRQLLDKYSLPHINYTTHYPCWLEFNRMEEIRKQFNLLNESYVLEDIYFNYFPHEEPILDNKIRLGIWNKRIYENEFQNAINNPNIKFVCNSVEGWSIDLENSLKIIINKTNN